MQVFLLKGALGFSFCMMILGVGVPFTQMQIAVLVQFKAMAIMLSCPLYWVSDFNVNVPFTNQASFCNANSEQNPIVLDSSL